MPRVVDEVLLRPMSFDWASMDDVVKLLMAEHERLIANARAIAFYAIRASMHGGSGSVLQSERTFRYMWLANAVAGLVTKLPPQPSPEISTRDQLVTEYVMLEEAAKEAWKREGGVLRFDSLVAPRFPS